MNNISSPVLFDANILIYSCENNIIDEWLMYFENPMIHREVWDELKRPKVKQKIQTFINNGKIIIVDDHYFDAVMADEVSKALFRSCERELKARFNVEHGSDRGEFKTLLFAKFNNVCIVSTQDNPVWELYEHSIHFKDVEFLTIQDIAFLMVSNGGKEIRKVGRAVYKHVTNIRSYPLDNFIDFSYQLNESNVLDFIPSFLQYRKTRKS